MIIYTTLNNKFTFLIKKKEMVLVERIIATIRSLVHAILDAILDKGSFHMVNKPRWRSFG